MMLTLLGLYLIVGGIMGMSAALCAFQDGESFWRIQWRTVSAMAAGPLLLVVALLTGLMLLVDEAVWGGVKKQGVNHGEESKTRWHDQQRNHAGGDRLVP